MLAVTVVSTKEAVEGKGKAEMLWATLLQVEYETREMRVLQNTGVERER